MAIDEGPPSQYLTAKGSSYCLVANDCDRNIYGQCNYIANRTLLRCPQIRRKDDLLRNGGQCDQHLALRSAIKERFERDTIVLKSSCPPRSPHSRKFTRTVKSDQIIVNQDAALLPNSQWASEQVDAVYKNAATEYFPFPSTDVMSEKEYALHQIVLLKREIDCLKMEKKRMELQSAYFDKDKRRKKRKHESVDVVNQGREEDTPVKPKKVCLHGQSDEEVVKLVVEGLVRSATEERERKEETEGDSSCPKAALPGSDYCIRHVQSSPKPPQFQKCKDCDGFVLEEVAEGTDGFCPTHKYLKRKPVKPTIAEVKLGDDEEMYSDGEFITDADIRGPAPKKTRRPMLKGQVSFSSVNPSGIMYRRYSSSIPAGPMPDAARCRPFQRAYFPPKPPTRPSIPYAHLQPTRPAVPLSRPPPGLANARMALTQQPFQKPVGVQRIVTQDRQRNRLQQEEDMKAAASIADGIESEEGRPVPGQPIQYRVVKTGATRTLSRIPSNSYRPPSQISAASLAMDIANLPEDVKNQPLGAVLRKGLIPASMMRPGPSSLTSSYNSGYAANRPRMPVQTTIRKPDTPMSSSVLTGLVRTVPAPNSAQRHQIASVDFPTVRRQAAVPPHRIVQRPPAPSAPQMTGAPRPVQIQQATPAPRVIPLERESEAADAPAKAIFASAHRPGPLLDDFVTELVDAGKVPDMTRPVLPQPVQPQPQAPEEKPDLLRKKTRPSLPLPKVPNVLSRSKAKTIPSHAAPSQAPSTSAASAIPAPVAPVSGPSTSRAVLVEPPKKKEKLAPRQGQRRSSRLDKSAEANDLPDPLSLLADVSAAVRE